MNIAIVDDLEIDCDLLSTYIMQYAQQKNITVHLEFFTSGETFLNSGKTANFSIIFLDIYMDKLTGMDVAKQIRKTNKKVNIIFSTTTTDYSIQGYSVQAAYYILKPITYKEVTTALDLCLPQGTPPFIEITSNRTALKIFLRDILYIDTIHNGVEIHTETENYKTYISFKDLLAELASHPNFLQCYRGIVINMDYVSSLENTFFILSNGDQIPIRKPNRSTLKETYINYLFNKMETVKFD